MGKNRVNSLAVGLAAVTMACADATAPIARTLTTTAPTLDVQAVQVVGAGIPAGTVYGDVILCKRVSTGDPSTNSFNFSVTSTNELGGTVTAPSNAAPSFTNVAPGVTNACVTIWHASLGMAYTDRLVITETGQANWAVADIVVDQYVWNSTQQTALTNNGSLAATLDEPNGIATVRGNKEKVTVVTFINDFTPPPPPGGSNGCTPGYWKQSHHFDSWPVAYTPGMSFNSVFGIGTNWFPNTFTLLDALGANGGGKNALARHAVAALLNSAKGFYPQTTAAVIAGVQAAYANGSLVESTKNTFATNNELGCTLD